VRGAICEALLEPSGATQHLKCHMAFPSPERCMQVGLVAADLIANAAQSGLDCSNGEIGIEVNPAGAVSTISTCLHLAR